MDGAAAAAYASGPAAAAAAGGATGGGAALAPAGGTGGAVPPQQQLAGPASRAALQQQQSGGRGGGAAAAVTPWGLRAHQALMALILAHHVAVLAAMERRDSSAQEWLLQGGRLASQVVVAAVICGCGGWYWRHRHWPLFLLRIGSYSLPSLRRADVGLALSLALQPSPGWRGALRDALRVLAGAWFAMGGTVDVSRSLMPGSASRGRLASPRCS